MPVIFATAPPGARLPFSILRGVSRGSGERGEGSSAPQVAGSLDGCLERADDVLGGRELAVRVRPALEVLAERRTGDGHVVPVDELVLE